VVCSPKPLDTFKGLALVTIQDGKICSLREDLRYDRVLKFSYGEVFSFAKHLTMHILQESKRRSLSPHSFSTFFFPRWLSNSSMTYNRLWTSSLLQITAISGHIFGAPHCFVQGKRIGHSLDMRALMFSLGYGHVHSNQSIKSFSGSC
jgi:hypothetical protein